MNYPEERGNIRRASNSVKHFHTANLTIILSRISYFETIKGNNLPEVVEAIILQNFNEILVSK